MGTPKQIVYRYNGDALSDETETDLQGDWQIPQREDIVERAGRKWKVVDVILEQSIGDAKALPVYRTFLSDQV